MDRFPIIDEDPESDGDLHHCGHYHNGGECPEAPCGDYRCCIN